MQTTARTPEFGPLLREWRTERRMSQADLAHAIETPTRHMSFLETGRSNPSREMVTRLATALEVPIRDRNLLYRAAGYADIYPEYDISDGELRILLDAVKRMLNAHDPLPSFAIDRDWNIRDMNMAAQRLLMPLKGSLPEPDGDEPPNMLDLAYGQNGLRPFIENFEDFARHGVQRLYRECLTPRDLKKSLDRVQQHPDLPTDWYAFDVKYAVKPVFPINLALGDLKLSFFTVISTVAVPTDAMAQELRVETLFPADESTDAHLKDALVSPTMPQ